MELNYLAVLGAGVAGMVVGMLWYMPQTFGTPWAKMVGVKLGEKDPKMATRMIVALLAQFVMAYVLAYFIVGWREAEIDLAKAAIPPEVLANDPLAYEQILYPSGLEIGLQTGFWLWLGLVATTLLSRVLWEKAPMKLYWINSLYVLVVMLIMSAILGVWA